MLSIITIQYIVVILLMATACYCNMYGIHGYFHYKKKNSSLIIILLSLWLLFSICYIFSIKTWFYYVMWAIFVLYTMFGIIAVKIEKGISSGIASQPYNPDVDEYRG